MFYGKYAPHIQQCQLLKKEAESLLNNATEPEFIDASIYFIKAYETLETIYIRLNLMPENHTTAPAQTTLNQLLEKGIEKIGGLKNVYSKKTTT